MIKITEWSQSFSDTYDVEIIGIDVGNFVPTSLEYKTTFRYN